MKKSSTIFLALFTSSFLLAVLNGCTSLGRRQENKTPIVTSTESNKTERQSGVSFYDLEDVFTRAQMPVSVSQPNDKGLVCLGRQPQVLNLDTVQTDENAATRPTLLNRERVKDAIGYPQSAKDQKITGKVVVKVLVDESGHVSRFQFIQENDPILRDAVAAHVKELLFKPGLENGKPAEWWVIVPFGFGIEGC